MKLFIDTNIYLSYFRRSDETLASLEELKKLLRRRKLTLVLPVQTRDEYFRNRNSIAEQSRDLLVRETEPRLNLPAPFVKDWPEAASVRKRLASTKAAYDKLLKKFDSQISEGRTRADVLIDSLFATAEILEEDDELLRRAYFRYLRGHPPRKNDGSFGDAIAWELLLQGVSDDLVVVTRDGDFAEKRRGTTWLRGFLEREWNAKNPQRSIKLYVSLGEFINTLGNRKAVKEEVVQEEKSAGVYWLSNPMLAYPTGSALMNVAGNTVFAGAPQSGNVTVGAYGTSYPAGVVTFGSSVAPYISGSGLITAGGASWPTSLAAPNVWLQDGIVALTDAQIGGEPARVTSMAKRAKFCPHCGKDVEAALSAAAFPVGNRFACPHCQGVFDPG
jgi:hypothetical protein